MEFARFIEKNYPSLKASIPDAAWKKAMKRHGSSWEIRCKILPFVLHLFHKYVTIFVASTIVFVTRTKVVKHG